MSERTALVDEELPVDGIVDFGDMLDINVLIHKAITDGEDVRWE